MALIANSNKSDLPDSLKFTILGGGNTTHQFSMPIEIFKSYKYIAATQTCTIGIGDFPNYTSIGTVSTTPVETSTFATGSSAFVYLISPSWQYTSAMDVTLTK